MKFKAILIFGIALMLFACKDDKKIEVSKSVIPDDSTLEQIDALLSENPNDVKILFERAKYLYKNEKFKEATEDMRNVLKIDSLNPLYYHTMADIYMDGARSRFAIKTMKKVVSIYPERIPSLLKLSEFYFIVKQYDESIRIINGILYLSPDNPEAYFMLGVNFKELGENAKAKNSFLTTVENNPEHIDAWLELGQLSEIQNEPIAETYYKNALLIDAGNISVLHHLAFYYQNNNKVKEALETYRKITILNPSYSSSYLNSGLIYLKQDSIEQAFDRFNLMVSNDKANPKAYYYRGLSHYLGNNDEAAKADFEQALKFYPEYKEAKNMLEKIRKHD